MHLYGTQSVNEKGHLTIGGVDSIQLVDTYQTPLIVYDIELLESVQEHLKKLFSVKAFKLKSPMRVKLFLQSLFMKWQKKKGYH